MRTGMSADPDLEAASFASSEAVADVVDPGPVAGAGIDG